MIERNADTEYHGLRGSASPVLTATGFVKCQWEMAIFDPPQNKHPLTDHQKKLVQVITSAAPTATPNLVQIRWWGLLDKWVKYNVIFFIYTFFHQLTYRSDATTDFYASWLKRRGLAQGCAFWGFCWYYSPFLGVKSSGGAGWKDPPPCLLLCFNNIVNSK